MIKLQGNIKKSIDLFRHVYRLVIKFNFVNKGIAIGIIIVIAIGVAVVSALVSTEETGEEKSEIIIEESETIPTEEVEPEPAGRNITLELEESIGLKSP